MKKKKKEKKPFGVRVANGICFFVVCIGVFTLVVGIGIYFFARFTIVPERDEALFAAAGQSTVTRFYYNCGISDKSAESGCTFNDYFPAEIESEAIGGADMCERVDLAKMPEALKNAFIAIEDRRFYSHDGVDFLRTVKAGFNYLFHFDRRFGGSTITQQLIKNIGGENDVSIVRKGKEMLRALRLEQNHTKEEILEAYLNVIPFGRGCSGVGMAARVYFDKTPAELSVAECASLAAITNSPTRFDPISHPAENKARRDLILGEMASQGYLTEEEVAHAMAEDLSVKEGVRKSGNVLSWYTETVISDVIRDLMEKCGYTRQAASDLVWNGGLSVYTLQDPELQNTLETYFSDERHFPSAVSAGLNCGMAVVDPESGDLLAIVGGIGKKSANRLINFASDTRRAPGSALKPLALYTPALEEGILTLGSVYDDVPVSFGKDPLHPVAWPRNSPGVYQGLITVQDAVAYSKNTVAIRVYRQLGSQTVYRYLTDRFHLSGIVREEWGEDGRKITDLAESPLALGQLSHGVTVREMTAAFSALANGGVYHTCRSYALVLDRNGKVLLRNEKCAERAVSKESAELMTQAMMGVTEFGTAHEILLKREVEVAGKTGTSGACRDRWFVGYTPYLCAGIWYGYPEGERSAAGLFPSQVKIWDEVMTKLHRRFLQTAEESEERHFSTSGLVRYRVCRDSGFLLTDSCALDPRGDRGIWVWFRKGTEPKRSCDCHVKVRYDPVWGGVITDEFDENEGKDVALIRAPWRDFPVQVYVKDAEFVYRPLGDVAPGSWWGVPFFVNTIPKGRFVGLTNHDGGRQFNAAAYERQSKEHETEETEMDPEIITQESSNTESGGGIPDEVFAE